MMYDMIWCMILYDVWYDIWCDIWYDMVYDMISDLYYIVDLWRNCDSQKWWGGICGEGGKWCCILSG